MIFSERRELLDGFRRGDPKALHEVYTHYVRDVARFLTRGFSFDSKGRRCHFSGFRGGYEIEAALQEIFRRAFEERARLSYDGINPYRPYLLRIARNAVLNDLKSKHPILFRFRHGRPVILETPPETEPEDRPSAVPSADDVLEAAEVQKLVQAFKTTLDDRESRVFTARFEEGLPATRAATQLELTRSQVRTTETKLRKRFLRHMQDSGYLTNYTPKTAAGLQATLTAIAMFAASGGLT